MHLLTILSKLFCRSKSEPIPLTGLETVWAAGFSAGIEKSWDLLHPVVAKMVEQARQRAIDETLARLAPTHRLMEAHEVALRPVVDLLAKKADFEAKLTAAVNAADRQRYEHYLAALAWILPTNGHSANGHHGH